MKTNSDELKLIRAALADQNWESCQARLRNHGLTTLRAAKRSRARLNVIGQLSALAIVLALLWSLGQHTRNLSSSGARPLAELQPQSTLFASSRVSVSYITEEQMLAIFPKGSCILAEVNGQKELVFFDPGKARQGFEARRSSN